MPELDPDGRAIEVGGLTLRTPGLRGVADAAPTDRVAMRSAKLITGNFDQALVDAGLETQNAVVLKETREALSAPSVGARSTATGEAALEVVAPSPGKDYGQVLLATDESGVMTWSFAVEEDPTPTVRGPAGTRTYLVRRHVPSSAATESASRGLVGAIGNKVLKVLAFKLIDKVAGEVGKHYVGRWETAQRPYRLREFLPADYTSADAPLVEGDRWHQLGAGRALLFVHGTFSRAHTGFGLLPTAFIEQMHELYGGRVFAFDHFTLSQDPRTNVEWLIDQIPDGAKLELDIICHSRGGLVSRELAERQAELALGSRSIEVRRIVFVGTPNNGTLLADPKHFGDLIDTYTSLLNLFPDTGVLEVIQTVISVVKQIAVGALEGLDGLTSMRPGGDFLKGLNKAGPTAGGTYFALASNYEPTEGGLADFIGDRLADAIFKSDNDLIVPADGVSEANGSNLFPIERLHTFPATDGIQHTHYFKNQVTKEKLVEWMTADP
jgi:pimeloyl-ACP methyl ester carboxylesterase